MSPPLKILISGAGIAGPCLAFWLTKARLPVSITIIERSPSPRLTGQSIDMHGPALSVIKLMKLEEKLRQRHTTEEGTVMLNKRGEVFATFESGKGPTAENEILRADLAGMFLEALEGKGVKFVYGDSITAIEQTEKECCVTFANGSKDVYDLVVAADGATSKTRPLILDQEILKNAYKPLGQYIAFFSILRLPGDPKMWQWYSAPKGLCVMLRPHRNTTTMGAYMCITLPARGMSDPVVEEAMAQGIEGQKRILHRYFRDAGWETKRVLEGMDAAEDFYMSPAAQVKLPSWTSGRAVVLGDAAWATFGAGTSLAIEGAYVLAGELAKCRGSHDIPEALKRYEGVYRPIYTTMEDLLPGFPQAWFPQTEWGLWVRNALIWVVCKSRVYKMFHEDWAAKRELMEYEWVNV
jgi:2-polyprenyl-6-methoxyphenol hydroxylase-like FAD-dependent oxidoreductase